ncbi:MAG TPA: polyketide synthase dehydratase domain-containing protein, partial [Pirellulales bacterium]|nr:polyketide synthase dehydratase domain-containing protein [Pirellulales bacterium]
PVRFATSVEQLAPHEISVVIEIGPTSSLLGMARRCLPEAKVAWLPSLRKGQDDWASILASLAELYTLGAKISWAGFDSDWPRQRTILPTYPFERSRHWLEPASAQRSLSAGSHGPLLHPLLGAHVPMALDTTLYEIRLSAHSPDYLLDHQVQGSPVLPAAAYVEQALASANHAFGPGSHGLVDVEFQQAMFLPAGVSRMVQQTLEPEQRGQRTFEISSTDLSNPSPNAAQRWTMHACGRLQHADTLAGEAPPEVVDLAAVLRESIDRRSDDQFYAEMRERGLAYGPAFQMLDGLVSSDRHAVAELRLPPSIARQLDKYHLHPVIGDALFQSVAGLVPREADGSHSPYTYMPVGVRRVRMLAPLAEKMFVHGRRTSDATHASPEIVEGDVSLVDADGRVLVEFAGVRVQRVGRAATGEASVDVRDWLYRIDWRVTPLDNPSGEAVIPGATWLIFADDHGVGAELAEQARSRGAKAILVHRGETFHKVAAHNGDVPAYVVNPSAAEHYGQLLEATLRSTSLGTPVVVHLWSLDIDGLQESSGPPLTGTYDLGCHSALELVRRLAKLGSDKSPRLVLATRGAQAAGDDASDVATAQAPLWGLGRVAGLEHPELHCRLIDLDPADDASAAASRLLEELTIATDEDQVVYRNGQRHVARLEKSPDAMPTAPNAEPSDTRAPRGKPFRLRFGKAGSFDTLRYETTSRIAPAAGQVEIAVHAAGVNFSDVLKVMGLYPGITDTIVPLGIEAAGIVTAVGPGVTRFKPGDEVLGVAPYSLASHALTADYALVHKPSDVDFRQASTIPITFLTAYYALVRLGQLQKGERLLIHAGAGGVGLAAIQIAQHLGAEVFATAGSDEKRDYLRSLGVKHVFSSRTLDFADEIMEVTERQGVDVVLNSLPGE